MTHDADPVDEAVLAWLGELLPGGAGVVATSLGQARRGGPWLVEADTRGSTLRLVLHVGDPGGELVRERFATEVAALELAAEHDLPAPRLVAVDLTGASCGRLAIAVTALAGSSRIPERCDNHRLRTLGRATAAIHGVAGTPTRELPVRTQPLEGADLDEDVPGRTGELFAAAREILEGTPSAAPRVGFAHGDFWQGNTLWDAGEHTGTVDWDFAGFGPAGIDLGSLRCDAAVMYGVEAADEVRTGWEEAWGARADAVPYWDVIAAAASPPDMGVWLPTFHAQGRGDLDLATVTARRDEFLAAGLRQLQ